ncbi:MAG: hypothetical protein WBG08_03130 [Litorimonas sp.]
MSLLLSVVLSASSASGPVYRAASRDVPGLRSRAVYSRVGEDPAEPLTVPQPEPEFRFDAGDLYCGWLEGDCAFVVDDPQLGRIVVRTPPVPWAGPGLRQGRPLGGYPGLVPYLAPGLQSEPRTRRSVPREQRK